MKNLQWLNFPLEHKFLFTNFEDESEGDASTFVREVNTDPTLNLGHNDWRLPTSKELLSLYGGPDAPTHGSYWSSSAYGGVPGYAFFVNFYDGGIYYDGRYSSYYVRLVR